MRQRYTAPSWTRFNSSQSIAAGGSPACRNHSRNASRPGAASGASANAFTIGATSPPGARGVEDVARDDGHVRTRRQRRRLAVAGEVERDDACVRPALREAAREGGEVARGAEKAVQKEHRARPGADARVGEQAHTSSTMRAGSSRASFTRTRNATACSPSPRRWPYETAPYIIGRITTWPCPAPGR